MVAAEIAETHRHDGARAIRRPRASRGARGIFAGLWRDGIHIDIRVLPACSRGMITVHRKGLAFRRGCA
jgi:hypothetical protein